MTSLYLSIRTFLLSGSSCQTFPSLLWGCQLHDGALSLARSRKREQSQGGRGKPSASGILVLELLVLTAMANSKPTNSQPPIQFSALVSLFTPVHGQPSSLFSLQFILKLALILFFMKYSFFFSRSLFLSSGSM